MHYLSLNDYVVIIVCFVILPGMGVRLSRRASASMED